MLSRLTHQPNYDRIFLEPFFLDFFLCGHLGAFFGLENVTNFSVSSIYKRKHSEQLVDFQTQTLDNLTYTAISHSINASSLLVATRSRLSIIGFTFTGRLSSQPRCAWYYSLLMFSLNREMRLVHVQCKSWPRKHCKNASAEGLFLCVSKLPVVFSVAVEGRPTSMPRRFKYRSVIKFAFMLLTVYVIGALLVQVFTPLKLDHLGQENGLPDIVMETSKEFLGE